MQMLHRVGVVSLAKFSALVMAFVGVLYGGLHAVFIFVFGAAVAMEGGDEAALMLGGGLLGALAALIIMPLFMGAFGFVMGLLYGLFINLALKMTGGLELDIR